ncbi:peptide-methionine (S)-S-oxide reductase [Rothia kristinae]|uniref:Peptide methionine sulfoxide reductase MsrA n=1 Tax=Rothia kristinae TaxID=37923 RepID=A0A1S2N0Y7_9MICC|nr:peptide-methionine (S)-S-oxide reductase MsrA [Rothia kristinae]OIJ35693.1 peptide-methionine (S)-S-oxide reductase [Rothia kristinae]
MRELTLAAGCFWCLDAVYQRTRGVESSTAGYTGGATEHPTYREVCTGRTGHAEAIRVRFDEDEVPADVIMDMFFTTHDPTSLNRQGYDVGTQYRSAVFYRDEEEKRFFQEQIARAQRLYDRPIVTTVEPLGTFWEAEAVHQDFQRTNPANGYCQAIIDPKLAKAREYYRPWLVS